MTTDNLRRCIRWRLHEYPPDQTWPTCVIDEVAELWGEIERIQNNYWLKRQKQRTAERIRQEKAKRTASKTTKLPKILEHWRSHLPKRPYCSNDLETGVRIRPRMSAIMYREIQPNDPWEKHCLIIDLDHSSPLPSDVPPPNIVVTNPLSGHRHALFVWETPILMGPNASRKAQNFYSDIAIALRIALEGDPNYQGTLCHNPLHPSWKTEILAHKPYQLSDFREVLERVKARPFSLRGQNLADVSATLGRNCATWEACRRLAYAYGPRPDLFSVVKKDVDSFNRQNNVPPLSEQECRQIAKSISNYILSGRYQLLISRTHSPSLQAQRGRASGKTRRSRSEGARAKAVALHREGKKQPEIAEILAVHQSTISRWLKA